MMFATLIEWAPTAILLTLGVFLFVSRQYLAAKIAGAVHHNLAADLEHLRSEFRKSEEALKSNLRAKQLQIENLREGALAGLASRRAALDNRRLIAVERIWESVVSLGHIKQACVIMGAVNYDEASKIVVQDSKARMLFETVGKFADIKNVKPAADGERPFVSAAAWALYAAYKSILLYAYMQLKSLESGVDARKYLSSKKADELLSAALPHYKGYIAEYGASGYALLIDELEEKLLSELQNMLAGDEADQATLASATNILKSAEQLDLEVASARKP